MSWPAAAPASVRVNGVLNGPAAREKTTVSVRAVGRPAPLRVPGVGVSRKPTSPEPVAGGAMVP